MYGEPISLIRRLKSGGVYNRQASQITMLTGFQNYKAVGSQLMYPLTNIAL